jgi:hypothetical protein
VLVVAKFTGWSKTEIRAMSRSELLDCVTRIAELHKRGESS